jgi:hypothetical protein
MYAGKSSLIKPEIVPYAKIDENNYQDQIIASLENDLSDDELRDYRIFISKNPHLVLEEIAFRKTYLKADQQSVFHNKELLKQRSPVIWFRKLYIAGAAVAAALILAFVLYLDIDTGNSLFDGNSYSQWEQAARPTQTQLMPLPRLEQLAGRIIGTEQINDPDKGIDKRNIALDDLTHQEEQNILNRQEETNQTFASERRPETPTQLPIISANHAGASSILATANPAYRTEMSSIAGDIFLRDAMRFAEAEKKQKNAFQRVWTNLTDQVFGNSASSEREPSLLNQVAEFGKERIGDFADDLPRFETIEEEGSKKTYFAINENFNIQINKKKTAPGKE